MKKIIISSLSVLVLITAGVYGYSIVNTNSKSSVMERQIATVQKDMLYETVEVSGNIQPVLKQEMVFLHQSKIIKIYVKDDEKVVKDQILAELDHDDIDLQIAQKEYELEQEKRSGSLRKRELMTMELEQLKKSLSERILKAPFDGIVFRIKKKEGEYSNSSEPFAMIINRESLVSNVNIDELDIPLVKVGQSVIFKFDALPGREFTGSISSLSLQGRLTEKGIAVREARLKIEDPDKDIFTPYSFSSRIIINEPIETLLIQDDVIIREQDKTYIQLAGENNEKIEILIKPYKQGKVIVLSGLSEGDEVLVQTSDSSQGEEGFFGNEEI